MKTRRVLAGALALTMTVSMFTSCGSVADSKGTDSKEIKSVAEQIVSDSSVVEDSSIVEDSSVEEDSSVVDAVSATETFNTEIAKLSDYFNGDLKSGNISLSAKVDMKNTNESFNWEKAAKYGTGGVDMVTDWGVVWDSDVLDFNISIDKKPVIATVLMLTIFILTFLPLRICCRLLVLGMKVMRIIHEVILLRIYLQC